MNTGSIGSKMAKKVDFFERFSEDRQTGQAEIEAELTGKPVERKKGRPKKREDITTLTLSISRKDSERIKAYAFGKSLSVSDVLHLWIDEHCGQE